MSDLINAAEYFAQYAPLARQVLSDTSVRADKGLVTSHKDMADWACDILELEFVSMFDDMDYQKVYDGTDPEEMLAYCYLAFLRWQLFAQAIPAGIGLVDFNVNAASYAELWYAKLAEKQLAVRRGEPVQHRWLN